MSHFVLRYEGQIDDAEQEIFDKNRKLKCRSDLAPHNAVTHNSDNFHKEF